jgi:DNA mismatch endonuclease (patch repair protein)
MARIGKTDTKPELVVRRIAHRLGYRFRVHVNRLPGTPDLTFPKPRAVVFVHGCFWHQHTCNLGCRRPKTRVEYWLPKLAGNVERDISVGDALKLLGWRALVIWECETRDSDKVVAQLRGLLGP